MYQFMKDVFQGLGAQAVDVYTSWSMSPWLIICNPTWALLMSLIWCLFSWCQCCKAKLMKFVLERTRKTRRKTNKKPPLKSVSSKNDHISSWSFQILTSPCAMITCLWVSTPTQNTSPLNTLDTSSLLSVPAFLQSVSVSSQYKFKLKRICFKGSESVKSLFWWNFITVKLWGHDTSGKECY